MRTKREAQARIDLQADEGFLLHRRGGRVPSGLLMVDWGLKDSETFSPEAGDGSVDHLSLPWLSGGGPELLYCWYQT